MIIHSNNDPQYVFDKHYVVTCPHCGTRTNLSAISIPRFQFLARFRPSHTGIVYCCDSCKAPVFLKFAVENYAHVANNRINLNKDFEEVERSQETFELQYLPDTVAADFQEALICFSNKCYYWENIFY